MFGPHEHSPVSAKDERFRQLVDCIADYAIYILDCAGHVVTWNRGAEVNKGYAASDVIGQHFRMFFVPEDIRDGVAEGELAAALQQGRVSGEGWRMRKGGQRFWASFVLTAMRDEAGRHTGFAKITRDLTEQKRHQDALLALEAAVRHERDTLHAAAESSLDALYICEAVRDEDGALEDFVFVYVNSNVEKMVRMPRAELLGARMKHMFLSAQSQRFFALYKEVTETGAPLALEMALDEADPASPWMRVQAVKLRDGVAITAADITQRKLQEARIVHLAHHDHLTGLPNRSLLTDRIEQACAYSARQNKLAGVFVADLNGFKQINDRLGHAAGDAVLREVASRMRIAVRAGDSVLRIGGDEFVIVCADAAAVSDLREIARKVIEAFEEPFAGLREGYMVTCSLGLAVFAGGEQTPEHLLAQADAAMYLAKQRKGNQLEVYTPSGISRVA